MAENRIGSPCNFRKSPCKSQIAGCSPGETVSRLTGSSATQSVSASATQAWRSDERLISRNHRARWRHRKVQRCTVGYRRGLAGRRGSGTTPHGSGPLSTPDDSAAGSEYQFHAASRSAPAWRERGPPTCRRGSPRPPLPGIGLDIRDGDCQLVHDGVHLPPQQADDVDLEAVRDCAASLGHVGGCSVELSDGASYPEFDVFRGTRTSRAEACC